MAFVLKKFISGWLMPLPLSLLLLLIGCACLWMNRSRIGRGFVTAGIIVLVLCSCTAISDLLLLPLEERYSKWNGEKADIELVVVMGASQADAPRLPITNRPNTAAVYRLLEGVAIYRANAGSKLVLSGGPDHVNLMQRVALEIGVPAVDIVRQSESYDTEQEVGLLAPIVSDHRFAVVTSAVHMQRTITLFNAVGLYPTPAPTHFLDRENPHPNWHDIILPSTESLSRAEFAAHEYLGLMWLEVKSWF